MTQIRGEQIKDGSIRDRHIAADAAISQSKISQETGGWISKGIVQIVNEDPNWDGSQEGELYYNDTYDTLRIGTGTDPYYSDLMGSGTGGSTAGWDGDINILMGTEGDDYDSGSNTATTFTLTTDQGIATDGTNMLVYLNGTLMENAASADYTINYDTKVLTFNYDIYGEDKVTAVIYSDASLTNYATKAFTFISIENPTTDIIPDTDASQDLGSTDKRWNNIYAVDAHFSASSIYIGDTGVIRFDEANNKIQISDDAGNSYADIVKSSPPGEDANIGAESGKKVVLSSDTAIEAQGDILPDAGSSRNIGSDSMRFAAIYADDVHVSQSSLYVNGKKVIEDESDTMTFKTDTDQAVQLKTTSTSTGTGNGNITLSSENLISTTALGGMNFTVGSSVSAKHIQFQNNSTDGHIEFVANNGSGSKLNFTGDASFSDNLSIAGNLTVNGSTTTVNTTTVNIQDNMIQVNSNQEGTPPDTLIGGIEVNRGDEPDYRFVFTEEDDTFRIGENGSEQAVATREDSPASNGVPHWNDANNRMDTTSGFEFDGSDLTVSSRRVVTVSSGTSFPTGVGLGDECYRTDLDEFYKYNGSTWIQI